MCLPFDRLVAFSYKCPLLHKESLRILSVPCRKFTVASWCGLFAFPSEAIATVCCLRIVDAWKNLSHLLVYGRETVGFVTALE